MQDRNNHIANTGKKVGAVAVLALIGAFLSRWHGGGFIGGSPKILKAFLWSLPFAGCAGLAHHFGVSLWWQTALWCAGVLAWSMVFKNTGHGGGMDLAHNSKEPGAGRDPEKLEFLILWIHGKVDQYWYDLILLTIIGLFSVAGAAFAVGWVNPVAGAIIALGGLGKPAGYAIGWAVYPDGEGKGIKDLDHATAIGEALTGLFAYTALGVAAWMVIS